MIYIGLQHNYLKRQEKINTNEAFKELFKKYGMMPGYDLAKLGYYGTVAYINSDNGDESIRTQLKNKMIKKADELIGILQNRGYDASCDYTWGSNMKMVDNGLLFAKVYDFTGDSKYLEYAEEQINYCFGKNPMKISYVTGQGEYSAKDPHHRPSQVAGKAVPGMLVAGPNCILGDAIAKNLFANEPAAKCYIDSREVYSVNEVDIYWNSALIYLMSKTVMK